MVVHSDLERTGWFECSDPLINQLHENVVWGMRGNFLDVPTDCPQRDERLGWTGDIQVFSPTACFLYDSAGFLQSWLADLAAEQERAGIVPFVIPNVINGPLMPAAAWGDAAVIVPWVLYQRYGDTGILAAAVRQHARLGRSDRRAGRREPPVGHRVPVRRLARPERAAGPTGRRAHQPASGRHRLLRPLGRAGRAGGRGAGPSRDADALPRAGRRGARRLRPRVCHAGRALISDATTAYALALEFGLLPDAEQRQHAGARLAALVRDSGYRISTGFVGTPLICDALCRVGEYEPPSAC